MLINVLFYTAVNFLLLGLRAGFALIVTVLAVCLLVLMYSMYFPDAVKVSTETARNYLVYYIYVMWAIGAIWRLLTFKDKWALFKAKRQANKKTNEIIRKYKSSTKLDT